MKLKLKGGDYMALTDLGLTGKWLVANCGKFPSEKNCKLVMLAPEDQRQDLLEAGAAHAIKSHGHADTPELMTELEKMIETVEA